MQHRYIALLVVMLGIPFSSVAQPAKRVPVDPGKFAVIINGASGEPAYAKQFAEWTTQLSSVLSQRYGFDPKNVRVLTEKPEEATASRATAEEVKRMFT